VRTVDRLVPEGVVVNRRTFVLAGIALAAIARPGLGHHAFSAVFDPAQPVSLEGTVTSIEWMNPHTWFYIDVREESGEMQSWGFEMGSPNTLARRGWQRDSLKVGEEVIVIGWRARDGTLRAAVSSVTLSNGQQLFGAQDTSR